MLRRLRASGRRWAKDTCYDAARGDHLEALQWLCENGCQRDEWICYFAAFNNQFCVCATAVAVAYHASGLNVGVHVEVLAIQRAVLSLRPRCGSEWAPTLLGVQHHSAVDWVA